MANKLLKKKYSTSVVLRKIQIKTINVIMSSGQLEEMIGKNWKNWNLHSFLVGTQVSTHVMAIQCSSKGYTRLPSNTSLKLTFKAIENNYLRV